ncbi:Clr5 domain-containing protein [Hypomontagnella monticulosa]|nr:Clr5 domain-containing protein [Hypomontagnella monticulosa]
MATPSGHNGWATADDWASQRNYITTLWYVKHRDENRTLKEIMQIMQEKYQFFATVRMYKARFQKWGIEKKIKAEEAVEIFRQQTARAAAGKPTVAYIRGRRIDPDRLQRYRYRAAPLVSKKIMRAEKGAEDDESNATRVTQVVCRTPSPSPSPDTTNSAISISPRMEEPTELRVPHECMQILHNFINGAFDNGIWQMANEGERAEMNGAFTWQHYVASSQGLIRHGRIKEGFSLLGMCFDQYKQQLQQPDSMFWLATYKCAMVLASQNNKLGDAFIDYASKLTSLILPPGHPFNQLWSRVMLTGLNGIKDHAGAIFESYLDMWGRHVNSRETNTTNDIQGAFVFIQLHCTGLLSFNLLETVIQAMISGGAISKGSAEFLLQEAKFRLALSCLARRRTKKAETTTKEIIAWLELQDPSNYADLRCKTAWLMFEIKERKGTQAEALRAGHDLLKISQEIYGPTHIQTLEAMSAVESYCRQIGAIKGAEQMGRDFESRWRIFRDVANSLNNFPQQIDQPWYYRSIELGEKVGYVQETVDMFERCLKLADDSP